MRFPSRSSLLIAFAALVGIGAASAPIALKMQVEAAPPIDLFVPVSQVVLDRNDHLLRPFVVENGLWRLPVTVAEVDPLYIRMLEASEDRDFRTHRGVDAHALLRASWQLIRNGRIVSGASTLTMQVVRLAERRHTRSIPGKYRQLVGALALERFASKEQILTAYLTLAPFGGNLEGVRAASLAYFAKEPRRLRPAEAALLVALPQAPEARRPDRHPEAARAARDRILRRAAARGVITEEAAAQAIAEPVPTERKAFPLHAAQMTDRIHRAEPHDPVIRLTIEGELQRNLETLARARAEAIDDKVSVAIMVADLETGEVLASVGSSHIFDEGRDGFVDMTRAIRSPGSTLKPFIYGLAFENGLAHPETLVEDRPTSFSGYNPKNFDKKYHGTVTVRRALELSLNVPAIQVLEAVGPARLLARFRRAGVSPKLPDTTPAGLAIGLGGIGLSLKDLIALYVALGRGGQPIPLQEIKGAIRFEPPMKPLMDRRSAAYVTDILAGTPSFTKGDAQLALKTGTSYGYRDAWAMGYDGRHVVGVWVGRPDGAPMSGLMGVDVAVPILGDCFVRLGGISKMPPPPTDLIDVHSDQLPPPLRRLRGARAEVAAPNAGPSITYPPDGAQVELDLAGQEALPLLLQLQNGKAPFTWFADDAPIAREPFRRNLAFTPKGAGFVTFSVVDVEGRADRVTVFLK